jgi:site-specific DNA-methyltransferase (adenine-specific)
LTVKEAEGVSGHAARVAGRWLLAFTDLEGMALWRASVVGAGLEYVRACIWVKPDATPQFTGDRPASGAEAFIVAHPSGRKSWNGGGKRNVYSFTREPGGSDHPTTKPLALMLEIVADFTDPGDIVLDPFAGSGTTGVACLRLGRRFIGIEKDEKYAAIARERLQAETQGLSLRDVRHGQQGLFGNT